jgi:DNA-directed RNA polymerase specialized sigma24 family protein
MLTRLDRTIAELEYVVSQVQSVPESDHLQEFPTVFNARFSRSHGLLSMTARRLLGGTKGVEEVVQNCWLAASRNPPRFESEAAFRSWLLRLLNKEALIVLNVAGQERCDAPCVRPRANAEEDTGIDEWQRYLGTTPP